MKKFIIAGASAVVLCLSACGGMKNNANTVVGAENKKVLKRRIALEHARETGNKRKMDKAADDLKRVSMNNMLKNTENSQK